MERERAMLKLLVVVLLMLWLIGFTLHVAGSLIHLLLVIAMVTLLAELIRGRRRLL
jgi:hypothetical protein